jgi:hypothetical protein
MVVVGTPELNYKGTNSCYLSDKNIRTEGVSVSHFFLKSWEVQVTEKNCIVSRSYITL